MEIINQSLISIKYLSVDISINKCPRPVQACVTLLSFLSAAAAAQLGKSPDLISIREHFMTKKT